MAVSLYSGSESFNGNDEPVKLPGENHPELNFTPKNF